MNEEIHSSGKVAFVTGAGRGLGRAIALRLASDGYNIALVDLDGPKVQETQRKIENLGRQVVSYVLDLSKVKMVPSIVSECTQVLGRIDVLVNNAGVIRTTPLLEVTEEDWDYTVDLNQKGLFFCLQAVARVMVMQSSGCIINVASISGKMPKPLHVVYGCSKAAVLSITKSAAAALAIHGIRVNAVCPGVVDTEMTQELHVESARTQGISTEESLKGMIANIPAGRLASPGELAGLVSYLVSPEAEYITGQAFNFCGGMWMD